MSTLRGGLWATTALLSLLLANDASAQQGLGFRFSGGYQDAGGDYGDVLDGHVDAEFSVLYGLKSIRLGGGFNWVSFGMDEVPDETWSQVKAHALIAKPFSLGSNLRAYVEGRLTYRRLRPEGDRYHGGEEVVLGDFVAAGTGGEAVVGFEVPLGSTAALDLSAAFGRFSTDTDLSSQGFGPIDSGNTWRLHVGVIWFPVS